MGWRFESVMQLHRWCASSHRDSFLSPSVRSLHGSVHTGRLKVSAFKDEGRVDTCTGVAEKMG